MVDFHHYIFLIILKLIFNMFENVNYLIKGLPYNKGFSKYLKGKLLAINSNNYVDFFFK